MNNFNLIISGVGGQGTITLLKVIGRAALLQGLDFKSSELHGLSQRGGSVKTHIRIGENISSPLIIPGETDLIIGLEPQEALRTKSFAGKKTVFLINEKVIPVQGKEVDKSEIEKWIKKIPGEVKLINAFSITQEKLKNSLYSGIFLLGYAVHNKLIPLSIDSVKKALEETIKPDYIEENLKALDLAKGF
ncbi:MAG: indolepyruvate oxidoreductase subunit beta [Candidatus Portnoybacteria bacterium]|nr:indolepyruvate oxidoreductase subunit beta [Candidatus Portnoybacteria bacterium]